MPGFVGVMTIISEPAVVSIVTIFMSGLNNTFTAMPLESTKSISCTRVYQSAPSTLLIVPEYVTLISPLMKKMTDSVTRNGNCETS